MAKREARAAQDATFTIRLSADRVSKLQKLAKETGTSPEDLLRTQLESWLSRRDDFTEAAAHVLRKNAELYRRLA